MYDRINKLWRGTRRLTIHMGVLQSYTSSRLPNVGRERHFFFSTVCVGEIAESTGPNRVCEIMYRFFK